MHGASADHTTTWRLVREEFERRFTVYAVDRRGRGGSGDSPGYDLQREAEDLAAVAECIAEPVNVLGHSYGGLCALEAALLAPSFRRIVLYESVPLRGAENYPPGAVERLEQMLESGNVEQMLIAVLREIALMTESDVELLRSQQDAWTRRIRNAPTIPRELRGERDYVFRPSRFSAMRVPTLLLVGADSPARELRNASGVAAGLPDAQIRLLPSQQHTAMYVAPELFVREVVDFLEA